eukprot:TRINITY_DN5159_c0_g1_i2.p1 TRINITY_DN5159_c0_g1~~TRINITY_DN5159_c0_g1_i2.p1  ORF type:complete len:302 (+),score=64.52 TRINITY_DN5159_c0_g1_i2:41-946(+)
MIAFWNYGCALLLSAQYGMQPILTRRFGSRVASHTLILAAELSKVITGLVSIISSPELRHRFFSEFSLRESLKTAGMPAAVYAIHVILTRRAILNLGPTAFQVLNQTKLLWTAMFSYLILGKKQTFHQMIALGILFLSALILAVGEAEAAMTAGVSLFSGVLPAAMAALLSAFAGTLCEVALKKRGKNVLTYSAELGAFTALSILPVAYMTGGARATSMATMLTSGWDLKAVIPVLTNLLGGVLSGVVTKMHGATAKAKAAVAGMVLCAMVETLLSGELPTLRVWVTLPLVASGMILHEWA